MSNYTEAAPDTVAQHITQQLNRNSKFVDSIALDEMSMRSMRPALYRAQEYDLYLYRYNMVAEELNRYSSSTNGKEMKERYNAVCQALAHGLEALCSTDSIADDTEKSIRRLASLGIGTDLPLERAPTAVSGITPERSILGDSSSWLPAMQLARVHIKPDSPMPVPMRKLLRETVFQAKEDTVLRQLLVQLLHRDISEISGAMLNKKNYNVIHVLDETMNGLSAYGLYLQELWLDGISGKQLSESDSQELRDNMYFAFAYMQKNSVVALNRQRLEQALPHIRDVKDSPSKYAELVAKLPDGNLYLQAAASVDAENLYDFPVIGEGERDKLDILCRDSVFRKVAQAVLLQPLRVSTTQVPGGPEIFVSSLDGKTTIDLFLKTESGTIMVQIDKKGRIFTNHPQSEEAAVFLAQRILNELHAQRIVSDLDISPQAERPRRRKGSYPKIESHKLTRLERMALHNAPSAQPDQSATAIPVTEEHRPLPVIFNSSAYSELPEEVRAKVIDYMRSLTSEERLDLTRNNSTSMTLPDGTVVAFDKMEPIDDSDNAGVRIFDLRIL